MNSHFRIFIVGFLLLSNSSFACDCSFINDLKKSQEQSLEFFELVFIAEVVSVDTKNDSNHYNDEYQVVVKETFKGDIKVNQILNGKVSSSCSVLPEKGLWLIYTMVDANGIIEFSSCGISRSFTKPYHLYFAPYVPYPPTKKENNLDLQIDVKIDVEIDSIKRKYQAFQDLKAEIEWLRGKK